MITDTTAVPKAGRHRGSKKDPADQIRGMTGSWSILSAAAESGFQRKGHGDGGDGEKE